MTRLCERPGCSAPASCSYGIDTSGLRVWIDALGAAPAPGVGARSGALCRRHADAMVVPRGWQVDDRRAAAAVPAPARVLAAPPPSVPGVDTDRLVNAAPGEADSDQESGRGFARRRRRARPPEGPQPEQLVLLEFDTGDAAAAVADDAVPAHDGRPDELSGSVPGTVSATVPGVDPAPPSAGGHPNVDDTVLAAVQDDGSDPSHAGDVDDAQSEPVDATPIAPWRPVFDQADDLGGVLQARSPLLSRAFGRRSRPPASSAPHDRSGSGDDSEHEG